MRLLSLRMRGSIARNEIFCLIWRCYGPQWDILEYWGNLYFVYYPIIYYQQIKVYRVERMDIGKISLTH